MDVIVLSGGFGTRLKDVTNGKPKTMVDVNGKPFLCYLLDDFIKYDVKNVILAVGYKKEYIEKYFEKGYKNINITFSEEDEPLGTGGAIKKALGYSKEDDVIIMNGDVYSDVNLKELMNNHKNSKKETTLTLKYMENFDRYGVVEFNEQKIITKFEEKKPKEKGYINVGVYVMNKNVFDNIDVGDVFSIERDFFGKYVRNSDFNAYLYDGEFIDIGIPSDYKKVIDIVKNEKILIRRNNGNN